jgi:hypothetical protein
VNRAALSGVVEQVRRLAGLPSPVHRSANTWVRLDAAKGREWVDRLGQDGIVFWPGFLDDKQMAAATADLARAFQAPPPSLKFRADQQYYASVQPLLLSSVFADAAVDPDLLNVVSGYLRRAPFLSEADFRRVLPMDLAEHEKTDAKFAKGYSSSHWHHDMHGREVKVMIYLTDVGEGDQNFAYCVGSHGGFRSTKYEKSRFTEAQMLALNCPVLECYGRAGTAVIFDTNGVHRLRRFPTRVRDSVTFNYHPGRMCQFVPQQVHPGVSAAVRARLDALTVTSRSDGDNGQASGS